MLSIFHRTKRKVDNSQTIADLKRLAKKNVPRATFDFVEGGAQREISYARSTAAFSNRN